MNGNLYEIEHTDDFLEERLPFIGVESLSEFDDKEDLKFACRHIKANGLAGADQMLDMEQYLKVYAMEFLLKHWDGYANNTNNTYLYNDVTAVASPGVGDIKFKMIPWGVDQILKPGEFFRLGRRGSIAQLVRNDDARRKQLMDQIRAYRETLFSREHQQTVLKPLIDQMQTLVTGFGVPNAVQEIDTVRQQLRLAESAAYIFTGLPDPTEPVYILKHDTSNCLHASNTESIPPGAPAPVNFEVYHQQLFDNNHPTDLWVLNDLGTGKSLTNQAFNRNLHASAHASHPRGTSSSTRARRANDDHAEEFTIVPVPVPVIDPANPPGRFAFTGYFNIVSVRTTEMAKFGNDLTPRAAASSPGTPRFQPVLLLITLRISDDRIAASVVDDEESAFVAAGEGDDAFRFHRPTEFDVEQVHGVAAAVPPAELKRFVGHAHRTPDEDQKIAGLLVVGEVADALHRLRSR